jgi:ADP-heptose:LPS heptosyltransferase
LYGRTIPLNYFDFLQNIEEIEVYSFQKDVIEEKSANIIDLGPTFNDFSDTAAALSNLDLLISIDTSVPNLAGALGIPTWILLSYPYDWRWGSNTRISPWYKSARTFVQKQNNDWAEIIQEVNAELRDLVKSESFV